MGASMVLKKFLPALTSSQSSAHSDNIFTVFLSGFSADLLETIAVMLPICIPLYKYFDGMHFHY